MKDQYWAKMVPELYVSDIEKSCKFYVDQLGFKLLYERPESNFKCVVFQQIKIMLDEYDADDSDSWIVGELEKPYGRGVNFQMEIENIDELYDRVKKHNIEIFLDMHLAEYRVDNKLSRLKQFLIVDPDGYLLRFMECLGKFDIDEEKRT